MERLATPKQLDLLAAIKTDRDLTAADLAKVNTITELSDRRKTSDLIGRLIKLPRKPVERPAHLQEITEGMWKIGDTIFKVQRAVHGSGNLYAKELVHDLVEDTWYFEYARGAVRKLEENGVKLTLEDAKAFGVLYGTCAICGRLLTKEASIEAGIGPICAKRF